MNDGTRRRELVRQLVASGRFRSQAEIVAALEERGVSATQATVSRDLASLGAMRGTRAGTTAYLLPDDVVTRPELPQRGELERLLADLPTLRSCLLASLSGELRRLTGQFEAMLFLDLAGRLATRIVALAEADPAVDGARRDVRLPWPYTQAELASMIGGSRESVNRLLGDLTGRGLLHIERDHLLIPDLDRLAAEAMA